MRPRRRPAFQSIDFSYPKPFSVVLNQIWYLLREERSPISRCRLRLQAEPNASPADLRTLPLLRTASNCIIARWSSTNAFAGPTPAEDRQASLLTTGRGPEL